MSKFWNNQRYNTDWEPVDDQGNVTGAKDFQANREWDEANAPGGAWNFSPTVMAANPVKSDTTRLSYGTPDKPLPAPGSGAAGAAPYGTLPNNTAGTANPLPSASGPAPAWMNWQPPADDYNAQAMGQMLGPPEGTAGIKSAAGPNGPQGFTSPAPPAPSGLEQTLYSTVQNQIGAPTTVDRNDPAYQQQINAYNANNQRSTDRQRATAAARAHAGGTLNSGGFDGSVNRLTQDQGLNEQAFEAQLMDSLRKENVDRQGRAQQLGSGLVGMDRNREMFNTGQRNNLWMSNQGHQIARELGLGDLGLRQSGLGLQRELGLGDLDFRRDALGQQLGLGNAQLNQQALLALLQGF